MTLIITRTSQRYALMLTDRRVTAGGAVYDPNANKNIVFHDRNAVVAIGYTGLAHIGTMPTDQWIAQTLTGLQFAEGLGGQGSVPAFMTTDYEQTYWGIRFRQLKDALSVVRPELLPALRQQWTSSSFDVVITGYEWNHSRWRPIIGTLSKSVGTDDFELIEEHGRWYLPCRGRIPVRMCAAPAANIDLSDLNAVEASVDSGSPSDPRAVHEVADQAEDLLLQTIRRVSARRPVVGPDCMSILIPPPVGAEPMIRIRYLPTRRQEGRLVTANGSETRVQVAFSPWIISPRSIRAPAVFTNLSSSSGCGPYVVHSEARDCTPGAPAALSGQARRTLR